MADTPFNAFTLVSSIQAADLFVALRGAGGVNFTAANLADFIGRNAANGSAALPGMAFAADPDTGIFRESANSMGFATAGVERMRINSIGNVLIGSGSSPTHLLTVASPGTSARIRITDTDSVYGSALALTEFGGSDGRSGFVGANGGVMMLFGEAGMAASISTAGQERVRVDTSGYVGIGTTSPEAVVHAAGETGSMQLLDTSNNSTTSGANLALRRSRGSLSARSDVTSGDWLGGIFVLGYQGGYSAAAQAAMLAVASQNFAPGALGTELYFGTTADGSSTRAWRLVIGSGALRPNSDNSYDLGTASQRFAVVRAGTGTIATSDERLKQDIGAIPDEWLDAWGDVEWVRYKFNDAVEAKGDDARWHFGLVAQRVRDAFEARGLDALKMGLLCYDTWEEQLERVVAERTVTKTRVIGTEATGVLGPDGQMVSRQITEDYEEVEEYDTGETRVTLEAGDRWGLRYDECQAMEAAWQRRELARKDALIADLANRLAVLEAA